MKTKIFIGLVLLTFGLTFLVVGEVSAAKKSSTVSAKVLLPVDGAHPPEPTAALSPVMYEGAKLSDCTDINPEVWVVQHHQWGSTYYDYQKNGSMGRMIAVGPGGHKHMIFHETEGPYSEQYPRYVTYNCKDPLDNWLGPSRIDGGSDINAGYANIAVMRDGRTLILYHRTAGSPCWNSTLAIGDSGNVCSDYFTNLYDIPDKHQGQPDDERGFWPKGCVVYDADVDTDYVHIVTTQTILPLEPQTIGYQRCAFQDGNLICCSPTKDSCYTTVPNQAYPSSSREIAVIDSIMTISAVAVSSPASEKVAIVYTKNREDNQVNNDVLYIESTSNGEDWLDGTQWPPIRNNVTNYPAGNGPRAYADVAACYDYNDELHIVWNAHYYDSINGTVTYKADLYHWSQATGISLIAEGPSDGIQPGAWNRTISKPSVATLDSIYHPGGDPDSVFLFCTWTQFNPNDLSAGNMTNGEIYANVSTDAGLTWTRSFNLTNTQTPNCEPGECLSEHWSSLAENMYDGDLYIEYVCDRDAGGIVGNESEWTDNDMMYMHVAGLPTEPHCGIAHSPGDPASLVLPPIKVAPPVGGSRIITFDLTGIYNLGGDYAVASSDPRIMITGGSPGSLSPGQTRTVEVTITCTGEAFITATITITGCIGTEDQTTIELPIHVVCSEDYFECPIHPCTKIVKDNCKIRIEICVNGQEFKWLKLIQPEEKQQVIFSEGTIVATTTLEGDTIVGRQDYSDIYIQARDTIKHVQGYNNYFTKDYIIQRVHIRNSFMFIPPFIPPWHCHWWWIDIHKQIIVFDIIAPDWRKDIVIKKKWIDWSSPPLWWPDPDEYPGHDDIYFGLYADIDAAFDDGCLGCNEVGYDEARQMVWFQGWYNDSLGPEEGHPEYEDQYVGLAFTDDDGNVVRPRGCHVVINDSFLYPQDGWGWLEGELYQLAADTGVFIHPLPPDSIDPMDRSVVMTTDFIPAAGPEDTTFESEYILIEIAVLKEGSGLEELQAEMDSARNIVIPELKHLGILRKDFKLPICGDINLLDGIVDVGDIICLLNYLYRDSWPPPWPIECWADVNADGNIDSGDIIYLLNYLYGYGPPPQCPVYCYYDCSTGGE